MRKDRKNCTHFKTVCELNLKNTYQQCQKYKSYSIDEITIERNALLVSKENPERLKELQNKINYFEYGIKTEEL